jgi:hypothetical protein
MLSINGEEENEHAARGLGVLQETGFQGGQEGWREGLGELDTGTADGTGETSRPSSQEKAESDRSEVNWLKPRYAIYVLLDAEKEIFYVGQTTNPPERLRTHRVKFGWDITMRLIQNVFIDETPFEAEAKWIRHYLNCGCDLVNRQLTTIKEDLLKVRIGAEDKAVLTELADQESLSLSAWARMHLLRIARANSPAKKKKS